MKSVKSLAPSFYVTMIETLDRGFYSQKSLMKSEMKFFTTTPLDGRKSVLCEADEKSITIVK